MYKMLMIAVMLGCSTSVEVEPEPASDGCVTTEDPCGLRCLPAVYVNGCACDAACDIGACDIVFTDGQYYGTCQ